MKATLAVLVMALVFNKSECASSKGQRNAPSMIDQLKGVSEWLAKVHTLLSQRADTDLLFAPGRPPHKIQLARQGIEWSRQSANSPSTWSGFSPSRVAIKTPAGGVLLASFGSHVSRPASTTAFQARFVINSTTAFQDNWGAFHVDRANIVTWSPFCFAQMFDLPEDSQSAVLQLQTKSSPVAINGGGVMAAVFPPPASISSIRACSENGVSNQKPYGNLAHDIDVKADKALLVMAANGRIRGKGAGNASVTFTVDGASPTHHHGKHFGVYTVSNTATGGNFLPMGLYQLAKVSGGKHKVQLEGSGSAFDLNYVTSQVTIIPLNQIQYQRITADWEMTVNGRVTTPLIAAQVVATADSVLVISTSFGANGLCANTIAYYQFNVDGKRLFPSVSHSQNHQLGAWHMVNRPSSSFSSPYPGSMLAFTRVSKGSYRVELVVFNEGSCQYKITGAVLQVGVVPEVY